jgi:hypothetical protein
MKLIWNREIIKNNPIGVEAIEVGTRLAVSVIFMLLALDFK